MVRKLVLLLHRCKASDESILKFFAEWCEGGMKPFDCTIEKDDEDMYISHNNMRIAPIHINYSKYKFSAKVINMALNADDWSFGIVVLAELNFEDDPIFQ